VQHELDTAFGFPGFCPSTTSGFLVFDGSGFESVSSNRCFMSLAIVKKTSSTFMFVLALCIHGQINQSKSWINDFQQLSDQCLLSDQADFTQTYLGRYMRASLKSWHAPYSQIEASWHNCNQIQITLQVPQIITGHCLAWLFKKQTSDQMQKLASSHFNLTCHLARRTDLDF
jgi:hypothetical protein